MWRVDSLEKTLMLGGIGGRRRRGRQRMRWLDGIIDLMDLSLSELRKWVMDREAWSAVIHGFAKSWTRLSDWSDVIPERRTKEVLCTASLVCFLSVIILSMRHIHNRTHTRNLFRFTDDFPTEWIAPCVCHSSVQHCLLVSSLWNKFKHNAVMNMYIESLW